MASGCIGESAILATDDFAIDFFGKLKIGQSVANLTLQLHPAIPMQS
jgi:hypothetical protein